MPANFTGSLAISGSLVLTGSISTTGTITISGSILSASYASNAELLDNLDSTSFVYTSSFNTYSSSMSTRVTNLESTSSVLTTASASFTQQSGSNSVRFTNLESTASVLTTASASFAIVSSSFATTSASLSTRTTNLETTASVLTTASASFSVVSASFASTSGSLSTRVTNTESTGSSLVTASGSFAQQSGSNSIRLTNLESTASVLTTASSSFAVVSSSFATTSGSMSLRITNIEGNYATTGSNIFTGAQTICANITSTGTIIAQTINVQQVTSSIVYSSGSNVFGNLLTDVQQFTGSLRITGSLNTIGNACMTSVCSPAFVGGTISGTTVYASTVVCSPSVLSSGTICSTGNTCFGGMSIVAGCVGIGTVSPSAILAVSGSIALDGTSASFPSNGGMTRLSNGYTYFVGKSNGNGAILGNGDGTATVQALSPAGSNGYLIFETGAGSERLRIASTGIACFACTVCALNIISSGAICSSGDGKNLDIGGVAVIRGNGGACFTHELTTGAANVALYDQRNASGIVINRINAGGNSYFNSGCNVGIGTTNPTTTLHVRTDDGVLIKGATSDIDAKLSFLPASGGRQYDFRNYGSSFGIKDASADTIRMYFHFNGNIGIGTTSPCALLHIAAPSTNGVLFPAILNNPYNDGVAGYGVGLRLQNSTISGAQETNKWAGIAAIAGGSSGYSNETDLAFYVGCFISAANCTCPPVEKMRIQSSTGNVGIGLTTPQYALSIQRTGNVALHFSTNGCYTGEFIDITGGGQCTVTDGNSAFRIRSVVTAPSGKATGNLGFWVNCGDKLVERMHIGCTGNVGIGTNCPQEKLTIDGTSCGAFIRINNASTGDVTSGFRIYNGNNLDTELYTNPTFGNTTFLTRENLAIRAGGSQRVLISCTGIACFACQVCSGNGFYASSLQSGITIDSTTNGDTIIAARGLSTALHGIVRTVGQNGVTCMQIISTRDSVDGNLPASVNALWGLTNHAMVIATCNTERMRITSAGLVGIGGTPSRKLDIYVCDSATYATTCAGNVLGIINTYPANNTFAGITFATEPTSGNAGIAAINSTVTSAGNADLMFITRASSVLGERMRITSAGIACFACRVCAPAATITGTLTVTASPGVFDANIGYLGTTYNLGPGETVDTIDFKICGASASTTGNRFGFWTQAGNVTPVERLRIDKNGIACFACQVCAPAAIFTGCVGIGVTSPATTLHVAGEIIRTDTIRFRINQFAGGDCYNRQCFFITSAWAAASNRSQVEIAQNYGGVGWYILGAGNCNCYITYKLALNFTNWLCAQVRFANYADGSTRSARMQYSWDNGGTWNNLGVGATFGAGAETAGGVVPLNNETCTTTGILSLRFGFCDGNGSNTLVGWDDILFIGCGKGMYIVNGLG